MQLRQLGRTGLQLSPIGFGAFKTARQAEFLPEGMFGIFDVLMHEETRHIVFFINYMAWREKHRGHIALTRAMKSAWFYGRAARRLFGMVQRGQDTNDGRDFAVTQAKANTRLTVQAMAALSEHGKVAPAIVHDRVDYAGSMIDGRTVQEIDPKGRSAAEMAELWEFLRAQMANSTKARKRAVA